ncbi:class I SAM-dependent methyltransferase [Pseudomonas sp. N040]|uniref:class I SAM-dependent methyltransferase n=1 Tax=Pseudomonas sp. N040 TaxID=2785325 RepID=UPI0018A3209D|nr:class I SAM-dependent methyltransferase [Pseudomonas sp. N040]MBF7731081.1 methyltransferase domain-containing protein [Pseudomonas sp. N040]MBW7014724.1 methyltransferase domain-containing protein [Pseudomonas sp. N040]
MAKPPNQDQTREAGIVESWHANAQPWVSAVRTGQIASRQLVTDAAIIDAVRGRAPASVLDIGCGEGWLARELAARGIRVSGIDAVAELVQAARQAGGGDFRVMTYAELAAGQFPDAVDCVVCNFSLLGKASAEQVVHAARGLLTPAGCCIVQTLHPLQACGELPYADGWREGSWQGFSSHFRSPPPWYFRTLESWTRLFASAGLRLCELREPLDPRTGKPASLIILAVRA